MFDILHFIHKVGWRHCHILFKSAIISVLLVTLFYIDRSSSEKSEPKIAFPPPERTPRISAIAGKWIWPSVRDNDSKLGIFVWNVVINSAQSNSFHSVQGQASHHGKPTSAVVMDITEAEGVIPTMQTNDLPDDVKVSRLGWKLFFCSLCKYYLVNECVHRIVLAHCMPLTCSCERT